MADTGFVVAGTGTDVTLAGTPWTSPGNITADDATRALSGNAGTQAITNYLRASNFGFALPAGATIDGIQVRAQRHAATSSMIRDNESSLFNASGIPTGADITGGGGAYWSNIADTVVTFGGASTLFGLTPSESDVEDVDWGWGMSAEDQNGFVSMYCDLMEMKIYYTAAAPVQGRFRYRRP